MSDNITKRVGLGTAYGFAKAGGYEGTVEEFTELLGNIAIDLARIENLSVTVTTLPAGSQATASLNGSVLSLGIPKGDKGDKGNTGETGAPAGFGTVSATVDDTIGTPSVEVTASGADTAKNFAFAFHNLKGEKGDKGDTGEVSEAELTQAFEDFSENGTVANAEQLTTDIRANDQTPYLFRTAGGSVDIGDREYINGIVGGTVAFNQLIKNGDFADGFSSWASSAATTQVSDGVLSFTSTAQYGSVRPDSMPWVENHKYLLSVDIKSDSALGAGDFNVYNGKGVYFQIPAITASWHTSCAIAIHNKVSATSQLVFQDNRASGWTPIYLKNVYLIDLTQMFGSTIADYIYSLEQATAGAGVAFFKTLFPKPYYAYNAGELMSVKGLVSHDMVGFNAWDEEWEVGGINENIGTNDTANDIIRSKNYIAVVPNTSYYCSYGNANKVYECFFYDADKGYLGYAITNNGLVTTPANCAFMRFRCRSAYGTTYNHDICINLSWDGSRNGEYEPYQKWSYPLDSDLELRGKFKLDANNSLYADGDVYPPSGQVQRKYGIRAYQSGDELLADAITDGTTTVYKLTTPTTETADPYTSPQIVNDFGTEEFVISNTVAVPIPVGNNTDYPINLKAKVEMAPNSPDGDGDYIVRQTSGTNEYVSIANNATIQNILARLTALEG